MKPVTSTKKLQIACAVCGLKIGNRGMGSHTRTHVIPQENHIQMQAKEAVLVYLKDKLFKYEKTVSVLQEAIALLDKNEETPSP